MAALEWVDWHNTISWEQGGTGPASQDYHRLTRQQEDASNQYGLPVGRRDSRASVDLVGALLSR